MTDQNNDYHIFGGSKFIESMRSSGYRDTSYAIGELIDNSIDAGAKNIEIVCQEKMNPSSRRASLNAIAVLDDGQGMTAEELRSSLLFGDGTRGSKSNEIGKYGMGLPNSSLSQCKMVEVYSWKNSSDPHYSYIDIDEVKAGKRIIPIAKSKKIPDVWKNAVKNISKKSGTLVVWSSLDRCSWVTSRKIIEHSQFLIGRIYRKFLDQKEIVIHMTTYKIDDKERKIEKKSTPMLPNDPMYLMTTTSTPEPWNEEAMFKPDTIPEEEYKIDYDDEEHLIKVRYSIEKDSLRTGSKDLGGTKVGQHARKNMGVSILRADREIVLDTTLFTSSDPRDRWMGVEIEVPPALDLLVGLTNNKQGMHELVAMMRKISLYNEDDSEKNEFDEDLEENDRALHQIFEMIRGIRAHIRSMENRIRATRLGSRKKGGKGGDDDKIEGALEQEEQKEKGRSAKMRDEIPEKERFQLLKGFLTDGGYDDETASDKAKEWIKNKIGVNFITKSGEGSNFFSINNVGGILHILINSNHRAYKNLIMLTEEGKNKELSSEQKIILIRDGLKLLLTSWARYEDLIENNEQRKLVQDVRHDWGRQLDKFLAYN